MKMANCARCKAEISNKDLYEDRGMKVCEDCKMKNSVSPPESCATMKNMIK